MIEQSAPKQLLTAAWVAPITAPPFRDGGVVIRGDRIVAVGPSAWLRDQHPDAIETDCGDSVLLPGLVNAHAHLELSYVERPPTPGSFVDWLRVVIGQTAQLANSTSYFIGAAFDGGIKQCTRFGVTSVGDVTGSQFSRELRIALTAWDGQRVVSYGEVTAMAQRRGRLEQRLAVVADVSGISDPVRVAISPHAPYSIEAHGYRRCLETARELQLPIMTHLAETRHEAEFLAAHSGPFRELWDSMNAWDDQVPTFSGGPIRYAELLGLLDYDRALLAHVNYCDDDELAILAKGKASVVYCPRTHRYFGHPPHRWRDMLAAGVNVAVGTDSCASSPDLNLVDDLRLMHEIAPEVEPRVLWEMATVRGARAIDAPRVGSLAPGQYADLVGFPVNSADPLREVLESKIEPVRVWCGGRSLTDAPK